MLRLWHKSHHALSPPGIDRWLMLPGPTRWRSSSSLGGDCCAHPWNQVLHLRSESSIRFEGLVKCSIGPPEMSSPRSTEVCSIQRHLKSRAVCIGPVGAFAGVAVRINATSAVVHQHRSFTGDHIVRVESGPFSRRSAAAMSRAELRHSRG